MYSYVEIVNVDECVLIVYEGFLWKLIFVDLDFMFNEMFYEWLIECDIVVSWGKGGYEEC